MPCDELDLLLGQMFVFGFQEPELTDKIITHFRNYPAGGIILFRRNIRNVGQVKKLTTDLRDLANSIQPDKTLLIAVDQEGGNLSPLRGVVTSLPGNMGLAATGKSSTAYSAGFFIGNDLKSLGINLNFTPVLDLALQSNPVVSTRAFSDNPETVAVWGKEYAKGLLASGTLFTCKHFPGHGCCNEDSHVSLPICHDPLENLMGRDLIPFREVIRLESAAVMMAHVKYQKLDDQYPASLSSKIINELLRKKLEFKGVVITDCLEMNAIQKFMPYPDDAVRAIEAGNDMVLISHTLEHQQASFKAVRRAVKEGRIKISQIEESVQRINNWKNRVGKSSFPLKNVIDSPEKIAEKVITFRANQNDWVFNNQPLIMITPEMSSSTLAEDFNEIDLLLPELEKCSIPYLHFSCSENPSVEEINHLIFHVNSKNVKKVVFVISNLKNSPGQIELINKLATTKQVLLISTRDPKEVNEINQKLPTIFTYSTETIILRALALVLSGKISAQGKIPIVMR